MEGMGQGGQLPLSHEGVEGGPPPSQVYDSFFPAKIGLNCSEMLLPGNSMWNFIAFAHLHYLKMILRFCIEDQA